MRIHQPASGAIDIIDIVGRDGQAARPRNGRMSGSRMAICTVAAHHALPPEPPRRLIGQIEQNAAKLLAFVKSAGSVVVCPIDLAVSASGSTGASSSPCAARFIQAPYTPKLSDQAPVRRLRQVPRSCEYCSRTSFSAVRARCHTTFGKACPTDRAARPACEERDGVRFAHVRSHLGQQLVGPTPIEQGSESSSRIRRLDRLRNFNRRPELPASGHVQITFVDGHGFDQRRIIAWQCS